MALNARDFTLPGQWAKNANTTIPLIPIRGQAYRNAALAKAIIENGQNYDIAADSAVWNQLMYLASGMALESEQYGIPRWSPLTDYAGGASLAIGTDGIPYRAMLDSGPSGAGPQDPATTTGYWQSLADWIFGGPIGDDGTVLTVIDKENGVIGWRSASVPQNIEIFESSGTFTAPETGNYLVTCVGGGGGGGGSAGWRVSDTVRRVASGGGGSSGFVTTQTVFLEKSMNYDVAVGLGGSGGSGAISGGDSVSAGNGVDGGSTSFGENLVVASGGGGGGGAVAYRDGSATAIGPGSDSGVAYGQDGSNASSSGSTGGISAPGGKCFSGFSFNNSVYARGGEGASISATNSLINFATGLSGTSGICFIEW